MDYIGIVKNAYQITIKHKFLWIFGLFAGGMAGFKSFNVTFPSSGNNSAWIENIDKTLYTADFSSFWATYALWILGAMLIILIFALVMFVLNIISQAALV